MPEPAKDTAIEITPKPRASSVPIPRIVAEINRVASRVRDRNKKEEEDIDDADVLENDDTCAVAKTCGYSDYTGEYTLSREEAFEYSLSVPSRTHQRSTSRGVCFSRPY